MTRRRLALAIVLSIALAPPALAAQPYSARYDAGVIQLQDARNQTVVSIIPSVGSNR